jgi:hypothetical protein
MANAGFTDVNFISPDYEPDFSWDKGLYEMVFSGGPPVGNNETWEAQYLNLHDKIKENEQGENNTAFTLLVTLVAVPEPNTALLLSLGRLGVAAKRRG